LRISQVLNDAAKQGHKLTVVDMESLQNDTVSLPARELQELLKLAVAGGAGNANSGAAKLLLEWDCALTADSAATSLYEFWVGELTDAVTKLVVPAEAQKAAGRLWLPRVVRELRNPRAEPFGGNPEARRNALLLETLREAEKQISAKLGPDPKNWNWGRLHQVSFNHPLDVGDAMAKLFDRGPAARPGDGTTVNATSFPRGSFHQVAGASYREIFDLSDWDNAVGINVSGQSGQPGSVHYDDLLPLWLQGKYFPMCYSKRAVDRVTADVLALNP